jgi:hypothetical protein
MFVIKLKLCRLGLNPNPKSKIRRSSYLPLEQDQNLPISRFRIPAPEILQGNPSVNPSPLQALLLLRGRIGSSVVALVHLLALALYIYTDTLRKHRRVVAAGGFHER